MTSSPSITSLSQAIFRVALFALLEQNVKVSTECAEQLQRCAVITEEYERLIQEIKHSAFRNCFTAETCNYEWWLFENCFGKSVRAVRAPLNRETMQSDNFGDSARRYLSALENCFESSHEPTEFPDFASALIDEDAIYARTIYSMEYADRLWGLPQLVPTHPFLDNAATVACLTREKGGRVFGNGISRYINSADPKLNNLSSSCILKEHELQCYLRNLRNDEFYQELLVDRDHVIRSCIRSIRLQTQCHAVDGSRLRACLCSAREEFENRIQASVLQCVRRSHTEYKHREQQQYQHLNKLVLDTGGITGMKHLAEAASVPTHSRPVAAPLPIISASPFTIMQGTIWNGHCLCACPHNRASFVDPTLKHQMYNDAISSGEETPRATQRVHPNVQRKTSQDYYNDYLMNLEARRIINGS